MRTLNDEPDNNDTDLAPFLRKLLSADQIAADPTESEVDACAPR